MPFDCQHLRTLRDSQRTKYSDLLLGETRVIFRSDIALISLLLRAVRANKLNMTG